MGGRRPGPASRTALNRILFQGSMLGGSRAGIRGRAMGGGRPGPASRTDFDILRVFRVWVCVPEVKCLGLGVCKLDIITVYRIE